MYETGRQGVGSHPTHSVRIERVAAWVKDPPYPFGLFPGGEGILPLHEGAGMHYALAKQGQDGLATQGRDALATKKTIAKLRLTMPSRRMNAGRTE